MCHGSNCQGTIETSAVLPEEGWLKARTKMSDARTYNPRVASNEITMFRNMAFVNRSVTVSGPSDFARFSTPLNARKNAEICVRERIGQIAAVDKLSLLSPSCTQ